jgi:hypothetical protein
VVLEVSRLIRKRKETKRRDRPMDKLDKPQIKVDSQETIRDLLVLRDLVPLVLVLQDLVPLDLGIIQDLDLLVVLEAAMGDLGVDLEMDLEPQRNKRNLTRKR